MRDRTVSYFVFEFFVFAEINGITDEYRQLRVFYYCYNKIIIIKLFKIKIK